MKPPSLDSLSAVNSPTSTDSSAHSLREEPPLRTKTVGSRRKASTPEEFHARSWRLEREIRLLNPFPRPRGFVFKARTWEDWHRWRAAQENPRLW